LKKRRSADLVCGIKPDCVNIAVATKRDIMMTNPDELNPQLDTELNADPNLAPYTNTQPNPQTDPNLDPYQNTKLKPDEDSNTDPYTEGEQKVYTDPNVDPYKG
jgi:hypothetical protein